MKRGRVERGLRGFNVEEKELCIEQIYCGDMDGGSSVRYIFILRLKIRIVVFPMVGFDHRGIIYLVYLV